MFHFPEQEITLELIEELKNPQVLSELIPTIGKRILFKQKLDEYFEINNNRAQAQSILRLSKSPEISIEESINSADIIFGEFVSSETSDIQRPTCSSSSLSQISQVISIRDLNSDDLIAIPPKKKKSVSTYLNNFDLKVFLSSSAVGRALLAWYELKGGLDSTRQSYLVELISSEFINSGFRHLSNDQYRFLSDKIVETFPLEVTEAYFLPPVRKRDSLDNKAGVAKGKLVDKFKNKLTFLREAGVLPSRVRDSSELGSESESTDKNDDIGWLRDNREPLDEVYAHWDSSFSTRRQNFLKNSNLESCYELFPILKGSVCLSLIERDFAKLFANKTSNYLRFDEVFLKLSKYRATCVSSGNDKIFLDLINTHSIQDDYKHYLMILLLASLLPNKSRHIYGRSKKHYKPSLGDSRDGIILKVDQPGDVEHRINSKTEKLTALELPVQPFIIVVGTGTSIQKTYVYINKELYTVGTVLKGLDVCFKAYHVFHIRYQIESEYVWFFLQLALYELKSKWDTTMPNIINISNKIKLNQ